MTILFIGDPHIKITGFDLGIRFLSWVTDVILKLKPDMVVNLGDTFDTHAVIRSEIMQEFKQHVKQIVETGIPYYYVLGNHDFYKPNSSKYHALQSLSGQWSNLVVVEQPIDVADILTFIPHQPDFKQFPKHTREICVAHQTFVGADYGYNRPDVGVDADKVAAEIIISGHIHLRQEFGKVIYPGSPFSQSVNDIDQEKGVMLFDTETYKRKFIKCPLPSWRGLRYSIAPDLTPLQIHEDLVKTLNETDHWTVEITGPKAEIVAYLDSPEYKELIKGKDVKVKPKHTDSEKKLVSIDALSMEAVVDQWLSKVYQGSLDKTKISAKALEILARVRESGQAHK